MVKLLRLAIVAYFKYDGSMPASIDYAFISKHNVRPLHVEFQVMSITYPLAVCVISCCCSPASLVSVKETRSEQQRPDHNPLYDLVSFTDTSEAGEQQQDITHTARG